MTTQTGDKEAGQVALALYRKYRPRTFAEVIGQEHVTEPLSQALRSGRLHHAYLFSGPRGCGKTSSARILARSLNCERGPTPEPCGECESCRSLANDGTGSIDVIEIDAASHGGVDDARELRERAFFAPASSRYKIYVIDEAHMVSTQGFNALLKLVEEPPDYVKFIFATTEPDKVLGTIRSRTHHYPFRLIPPAILRPFLEQLCQTEGVRVDPSVFPLVVRAGAGSARDSLSVLDQLIAGAGPEGVSYARAVALLGVTDGALIDEMCDALAAGDGAAAYATVDRVAEAGHDPRRFASDLLERLRDLIVLQQVPEAVAKGLIDGPTDQIERMTAQAQRMGAATLSRCADIVHSGLVEMRGTTGPRLLLELVCARMLLPGADDSSGALLQRLERLERRLALAGDAVPDQPGVRQEPAAASGHVVAAPPPRERPAPARGVAERGVTEPGVTEPAGHAHGGSGPGVHDTRGRSDAPGQATAGRTEPPANAGAGHPAGPGTDAPAYGAHRPPAEAIMPDPVTPEPPRPGSAAPVALDAVTVRRVWDEVLGVVGRKSKRAAAVVREATVRDVDGQTLVLTFKHSVHASMLAASPDLLVEAVTEILGGRWGIRCEVEGDPRFPAGGGQPGGGAARGAAVIAGSGAGDQAGGGQRGDLASGAARPSGRPVPAQPHQAPGGPAQPYGAGGPGPGATAELSAGGVAVISPVERAGEGLVAGAGTSGNAQVENVRVRQASPVEQDQRRTAGGLRIGAAQRDGDGGWPEPARPGGAAAGSDWPEPARPGGSDWPEPARPGGTGSGSAGAESTEPAGLDGGHGEASQRGNRGEASQRGNRGEPSQRGVDSAGPARAGTGLAAQTGTVPGRPAPRPGRGGGATGPASAASRANRRASGLARAEPATGSAWDEGPPPGEPPFDPDYDGFDPGDEPLDDVVDEQTARQTGEEQALQLLRDKLGAEKIGEIEAR